MREKNQINVCRKTNRGCYHTKQTESNEKAAEKVVAKISRLTFLAHPVKCLFKRF